MGRGAPQLTSTLAVASLDAALDTANRLGATVAMAPMEVQGVGRFALLRDPQGAYVYVIQIAGRVGASVLRDRGEGRGADHQERRVAERILGHPPRPLLASGTRHTGHAATLPPSLRSRSSRSGASSGRPGFRW